MIDEYRSTQSQADPDQKIEILQLNASPYPDGRRVKVDFQLSPFIQGPNALISLIANNGSLVASVNIVNIFVPENEITLHIPKKDAVTGQFRVKLDLFHIQEEEIEGDEEFVRIKQSPLASSTASFQIP